MPKCSIRYALVLLLTSAVLGPVSAEADVSRVSEGKYAIVIGVQQYPETKGFAPLRCSEPDAKAFYDLLVDPERGGYDPERVKLLTTASKDLEQMPLRSNILAALDSLSKWASASPDGSVDTVLVYFSGHGVSSSGQSYLVPVDATQDDLADTAISVDMVRERLSKCKARKQIVIVDACRSRSRPGKSGEDLQSPSFRKALEAFASKAEGRVVLASCGESQASYEDTAKGHSAFTRFLLEGLRGEADADRDGIVTLPEVYQYVARTLPAWAAGRNLVQSPSLYGEIMLDPPLTRCPAWAEIRMTSLPDQAQVWIDGEDTRLATPCTHRLPLGTAPVRSLTVRLKKKGYQDEERAFTLRAGSSESLVVVLKEQQYRLGKFVPDLKATAPGLPAATFCSAAGPINGLAQRPDGSLLLAIESSDSMPGGIYTARAGQQCDLGDTYSGPKTPFAHPDGVLPLPDGRVLVVEREDSTIWVIPSKGAAPQVLTKAIAEPFGILLAPPGFEGPNVHPGDLLVYAGGGKDLAQSGLYVISGGTRTARPQEDSPGTEEGDASAALGPDGRRPISEDARTIRRLAGYPDIEEGIVSAAFGPDGGKLYAVLDDRRNQDGLKIVTIAPDGRISTILNSYIMAPATPQMGSVAIRPSTGEVFFTHHSSVYRIRPDSGAVESYATGGRRLTGMQFSPDGEALFVSDAETRSVVRIGAPRIDGKLLVTRWSTTGAHSTQLVEGNTSNAHETPTLLYGGDLSPVCDQVVYCKGSGWHPTMIWKFRQDIWKSDISGENAVNLTAAAGLTGINCLPRWSPDGSQVAFTHCDPVEGKQPCEAGFYVWVMNADGTGAHKVVQVESSSLCWSATGDRLICAQRSPKGTKERRTIGVSTDGKDSRVLRNVGEDASCSPDGSKIISSWQEIGNLDGESGIWRQLRLTDADGSNPRPLVEQFIKDSDMKRHLAALGKDTEEEMGSLRLWVGPYLGRWSPAGDRVVFASALPFRPGGPQYKLQTELWVYELDTRIMTQVTDDGVGKQSLSWRGPNTYPEQRQITVCNTTVTFEKVTEPGLTTIVRRSKPPDPPGGYQFCGEYYDIKTTAKYSGTVTIRIGRDDRNAAGSDETSPSLLRYNKEQGKWEDITSSRDAVAKTVTGVVGTL